MLYRDGLSAHARAKGVCDVVAADIKRHKDTENTSDTEKQKVMSRDVLIAPNEKSERGNSKYRKGKKIVASQASPFKNEWLIIATFFLSKPNLGGFISFKF